MNWFQLLHFLIVSVCLNGASKFEEFVVNGKAINIKVAPYSARLSLRCPDGNYRCGSSILTSDFLLTAGHCSPCNGTKIVVQVGHANYEKSEEVLGSVVVVHEGYHEFTVSNDIAIVLLKERLRFSDKIKRVAIYKTSSKATEGYVAGWGLTDEDDNKSKPLILQGVKQKIWTKQQCEAMLKEPTAPKTICGGFLNIKKYPAKGDSGSGLVVNGYIQVGVVSYKRSHVSQSLIVYTDVHYFYSWIKKTAKRLYCDQIYKKKKTLEAK